MLLRFSRVLAVSGFALGIAAPSLTHAQDQRDEQFYYPGSFNWRFLKSYPEAARLFNAFDYGHAVLYERLYTKRGQAHEALEKEYRYLTTDLLIRPPRFAVVEELISPDYSKMAWRAKLMFDWAHVLHRQIYDVYADERLTMAQKDSLIERLTDYYLSGKEYAFPLCPSPWTSWKASTSAGRSGRPPPSSTGSSGPTTGSRWASTSHSSKGDCRPRRRRGSRRPSPASGRCSRIPQAGSPECADDAGHRTAVQRTAPPGGGDFRQPAHDARHHLRHPRRGSIPHEKKREVIYAQLDALQDTTKQVMSWDEWRNMAEMMGGVAVMGGPATGLLARVHAPITPESHIAGVQHRAMRHEAGAAGHHPAESTQDGRDHTRRMMDLHMRMMTDPIIRRRVIADTAMHRLMQEMMAEMPTEYREQMRLMIGDNAKGEPHHQRPAPQRRTAEPSDSGAHQRH